MAITRTQIAKQLLANGGRIGLKPGGPPGGGATSMGSGRDYSAPDKSKGPAGGQTMTGGGGFSDKERQQRRDLRDEVQRFEKEKQEEKLEKFRRLGSDRRKIESLASKISPIAMLASKIGPLNTRDFLTYNVLDAGRFKYDGKVLTREQFVNLSDEEKENVLDSYVGQRNRGEIDAYGNIINRGDGEGINQLIPVDTTFQRGIMTQAPSITEQGTTMDDDGLKLRFRAEGGPIGGEYDFESARQMYGLGKLVKKVTRTVKKIAKSPIGKAAIIGGLGAYGLGALGAKSFAPRAAFSLANIGKGFAASKGFLADKLFGPVISATGEEPFRFGGLFDKFPGGGIGAAITAASVLPLLGIGTGDEDEDEAEELLRGEGLNINEIRANPNKFLATRFMAEGGSTEKEPVAKKTMPLLDMGGKEMDLRAEGGFVPIGRMEKADDVPARLSKNEFVFTADAVRNAGDGDVDKGAEVMYNMMKNLEAGGDVSEESQGLEGARRMFQTSQRLEEVL